MKDFLMDLIDNDTLILIALFVLAYIDEEIRLLAAGGFLTYLKTVTK